VARHSGCQYANVTVVENDTRILVEVTDAGCGFDADQVIARRDSIGLAGMAEKVHWAGGDMEIVSSIGKGTRIHAEFPRPITPKLP
jgi:signal transduction histidine kinase